MAAAGDQAYELVVWLLGISMEEDAKPGSRGITDAAIVGRVFVVLDECYGLCVDFR
jgi:hypothetical protein